MEDVNWSLSSIVYQIYPRSFQDSNNDGIGDLNGIINRVDYLSTLGITAIWLSPFYPSPHADFGYDISDYTNVDQIFGTLEDFYKLVQTLHNRNIKIIIDFVPNHTSNQHPWFMESISSRNNPKRDWYIWKQVKQNNQPPNNWLSIFGGSAWELDPETGEYYYHTFDKAQPDLNWRNPEVVNAMKNVLRFWLNRGVDGFRVDVPYHMFKDALFQDEPPNPNYAQGNMSLYESLLHIHTAWLPESIDMIKQFTNVLKEYKNKFLVAETWGSLPELIKTYITVGWKYFIPFNFSLITLPWKAEIHKTFIDEYNKTLGDLYFPSYVLGNHDTHRVASRIGTEQARIATMLQFSLRGLPFIYYGEELGMTDTIIPKEDIKDPFETNSPGLNLERDPERTPMQWDTTQFTGFSNNKPWLPVNENHITVNVTHEMNDKSSMFSLYKRLINIKKQNKALHEGVYNPIPQTAENVLAFTREKEEEKILVLLNFDNRKKHISLVGIKGNILCNATLSEQEGKRIDLSDFVLKGNEGYIIEIIN